MDMNINKRTRTTVPCHNKVTSWKAAISNSGRRSTITLRSQHLECLIQGFHPMTDWGITNKWNKMATGLTVHPKWDTWVRKRTVMGLMVTSHLRRRFIRRVNSKLQQRRQVESQEVRPWSKRSKCLTICTLSSIWFSTVYHRINST